MKRYNFLEILLSSLSWGAWLAMLALLVATGFDALAMGNSTAALAMSIIALILLFAGNALNHVLKFTESDTRNVIPEIVMLVYAVAYLIALFIIGFEEEVAWYPMGFLIAYFGGALIDILFVLTYNRGSGRSRRRRASRGSRNNVRRTRVRHTHTRQTRAPRAPHLRPVSSHSSDKDDYIEFLDTEAASELADKSISESLKKELETEVDKHIAIRVEKGNLSPNEKKKAYISDGFEVTAVMDESDWDWFFDYLNKFTDKNLFPQSAKFVKMSGYSVFAVADEKALSAKHVRAEVKEIAEREFSELCITALENVKRAVCGAITARFGCSSDGIKWLACGSQCEDFRSEKMLLMPQFKRMCAAYYDRTKAIPDVVITKTAKFSVDSSGLERAIEANVRNALELFLKTETERQERIARNANARKYVIIDSKERLEHLSTIICLYMSDRLEEMNPGCGTMPADKLPIKVKASDPTTDAYGECFGTLNFDVHFAKTDGKDFESFCQGVCLGYPIKGYVKKGEDFFMKHIDSAICEALRNIAPLMLGVRPNDTSSDFWTSANPKGAEPKRVSDQCRVKVTVHWADIPWDAPYWQC